MEAKVWLKKEVKKVIYWFKRLKGQIKYVLTRKKYQVVLPEHIKQELETLPKEDKEAILRAIEEIAKNPYIGEPLTEEEFGQLSEEAQQAILKGIERSEAER